VRSWRRGVLWLAAAAYFAASLAWMARTRPPQEPIFDTGSVFNTSATGLSLAYRYLSERRPQSAVAVLSRVVAADELPSDGVVFRVRPRFLPFLLRAVTLGKKDEDEKPKREGGEDDEAGKDEGGARKDDQDEKAKQPPGRREALLTARERSWIEAGGRLVLAIAEDYGTARLEGATKGEVRKVYPLWPGVATLLPQPPRSLSGTALAEAHAVLVLGDRPLVSRWAFGRGEVVLLACPEVLENQLLGQADHLRLLEALAGRVRPVFFDEYVHGSLGETGTLELMTRWGLGPLLVLVVAAGGIAFWRGRSRVGPAEDDYHETRSDAVDLLDSLAQLYDRAVRRDQALASYYESLTRAVSWKTGLRDEALRKRVREMAGPPPPRAGRREQDLSPAEFEHRLRPINEGFRRLRHAESR